jgi:hypothetical protein
VKTAFLSTLSHVPIIQNTAVGYFDAANNIYVLDYGLELTIFTQDITA